MLKQRALEFKHTPMIGRTHGIHAEPITFGLQAGHLVRGDPAQHERFEIRRRADARGQDSPAQWAHASAAFEPERREDLRAPGTERAPVSSQVIQRDRHAFYLSTLAVIAAIPGKDRTEIRHLQRTEVREVEEYFGAKAKGLLRHAAQAQSGHLRADLRTGARGAVQRPGGAGKCGAVA